MSKERVEFILMLKQLKREKTELNNNKGKAFRQVTRISQ